MKMLTTLAFGALGVAGMAGGRLVASDVAATPTQGPRCFLTQGTDRRGGPSLFCFRRTRLLQEHADWVRNWVQTGRAGAD